MIKYLDIDKARGKDWKKGGEIYRDVPKSLSGAGCRVAEVGPHCSSQNCTKRGFPHVLNRESQNLLAASTRQCNHKEDACFVASKSIKLEGERT